MEDARIVRFVKFHGYLFLAVALSLVIRELWAVTLLTFEQQWTPELDGTIRGHPVMRWGFVLVWLAALAFMYGGMAWEDGAYLQPAKFVFLVEVGALLVRDLIVTMVDDDPQSRFIFDMNCLVYFGVLVVYVLYSFYALRTLFAIRNQRLGMKSIDARLAIVNLRRV